MTTDEHGAAGKLDPSGRPLVPFPDFIAWLMERLEEGVDPDSLDGVGPEGLYAWGEAAERLAKALGDFLGVPFLPEVESDSPDFRLLALPFCRSRHVVPVQTADQHRALVMSNPFDWTLWEDLDHTLLRGKDVAVLLASPETIEGALARAEAGASGTGAAVPSDAGGEHKRKSTVYDPEKDPGKDHPVAKLAVAILNRAVREGARDVHIEPSSKGIVVRAEIGGGKQAAGEGAPPRAPQSPDHPR